MTDNEHQKHADARRDETVTLMSHAPTDNENQGAIVDRIIERNTPTDSEPVAYGVYGRATGNLKYVQVMDEREVEEQSEFYDVVPLFRQNSVAQQYAIRVMRAATAVRHAATSPDTYMTPEQFDETISALRGENGGEDEREALVAILEAPLTEESQGRTFSEMLADVILARYGFRDAKREWSHCSPALLSSGVDCSSTPRRPCSCSPSNGGHDHLAGGAP